PKPAQTILDCLEDVTARQAFVVRAMSDAEPAFRRQDEAIALALQPLVDNIFRPARRLGGGGNGIDVGGVDELDSVVRCFVENGKRGLLVALIAKGHCANADLRYFQSRSAHASSLHGFLIVRYLWASGRLGRSPSDRL